MLLTIFLKIPQYVVQVMVALIVLPLVLKVVQGGVHHTWWKSLCVPPLPFLLRRVERPTKFSKREGLAESQGGMKGRGGCSF